MLKLKWSPRNRFLGLLLLSFFIFALIYAEDYKKVTLEPMNAWSEDPIADCAVVLTGGAGRVREGLSLLTRRQIKKLIISGVHPEVELQDIISTNAYVDDLEETDIVLEKRSSTTYGNAQQSLPLVEALSCHDVVLVTSQLHMARAYNTFTSAFPKDFKIHKYSLIGGKNESFVSDKMIETFKFLFYSLWAF